VDEITDDEIQLVNQNVNHRKIDSII